MISNLILKKYSSDPTILSSLAWNAVRDTLTSINHPEYVTYIESVKVTDKRITIKTLKPIVNQELSHHREAILDRINAGFKTFGMVKIERKIVFL